ncbi:hypothetical protein INT45_001747 [Circinella minor]|uniref:Uncharacterized protein n=1 Tax=Circinella minor TaxID=1195481 RepID=A0A8H7S899_9FUNG|nr:hypothetical protein INT45_001747 [Circinella minor]
MKSRTNAKTTTKKTATRTFRSPSFSNNNNFVIDLPMLFIIIATYRNICSQNLTDWHLSNYAYFPIKEQYLDLPIFTSQTLSSPWTTNAALAAFHEAAFDCGLTAKGNTYSFRYGFSDTLLKSNQRLEVAKQLLGHTTKSDVLLNNYASDLTNFDLVSFILDGSEISTTTIDPNINPNKMKIPNPPMINQTDITKVDEDQLVKEYNQLAKEFRKKMEQTYGKSFVPKMNENELKTYRELHKQLESRRRHMKRIIIKEKIATLEKDFTNTMVSNPEDGKLKIINNEVNTVDDIDDQEQQNETFGLGQQQQQQQQTELQICPQELIPRSPNDQRYKFMVETLATKIINPPYQCIICLEDDTIPDTDVAQYNYPSQLARHLYKSFSSKNWDDVTMYGKHAFPQQYLRQHPPIKVPRFLTKYKCPFEDETTAAGKDAVNIIKKHIIQNHYQGPDLSENECIEFIRNYMKIHVGHSISDQEVESLKRKHKNDKLAAAASNRKNK